MRYTVDIQPVIPVFLTHDWNLIIRTILPVIYAESSIPGGDNTAGLGDIVQSFFSPKAHTRGGWIWGVGLTVVCNHSKGRRARPGRGLSVPGCRALSWRHQTRHHHK